MPFTIHVDLMELALKGILIGIIASAPMGPVGVLTIQRTLKKGRWYGLVTGLGAAVSDIIYAMVTGLGMSFVHVNSFPMVVELCSSKKIGQFTGFYYASSMAAQTVTPCLLGLLLLTPGFSFNLLPLYALVCIALATVIFFFVKNIKANIYKKVNYFTKNYFI